MEALQIKKPEQRIKRAFAPIHIVSDFNDYRSHVECEQRIRSIFKRDGILYEPPHIVSDTEQFNVTDGAFKIFQLVNNLRREGDPGIFVGVVDPGVGSERRGIAVTTEEGYSFVGPDNGLFWPALRDLTISSAYQIKPEAFKESSATFHGRDQFTPIAAEIAVGKDPRELDQLQQIDPETLIKKPFLDGQVVERDGYPNVKIWQGGNAVPRNENGERANYLTITTNRLIRRGLLWSHSITMPVVDYFEGVPVGAWGVLEGSSGGTQNHNCGIAEVFIRDRSGKHGAGNRLRVTAGDVVKLTWK